MLRRFLPLAAAFCTACSGSSVRPPRAEFIIATADSTFWVSAGAEGMHVRGVPMTLARYGGRFRELYVADLDRSYDDALFTGERLYVRDLVSNDSALVYDDSTVVRLADRHARENPGVRPLGPDDDTPLEPDMNVQGETDILDVRGSFVLLEHRSMVEQPGGTQSDTVKTAIDLRATPLGLVKPIIAPRDLPLPDSAAPPKLPFSWNRDGYELIVRGDTTDGTVTFMIRDSSRRLWHVLQSGGHPRVYWLDKPSIDSATRQALVRAFNTAAAYDEAVKYVRFTPRVTNRRKNRRPFVLAHLQSPSLRTRAMHAYVIRHT